MSSLLGILLLNMIFAVIHDTETVIIITVNQVLQDFTYRGQKIPITYTIVSYG